MMPTLVSARPASVRLRRFFWLNPQWWSIALCAAAWVLMLVEGFGQIAHGMHHHMSFAREVVAWLLMVAAMMIPLTMPSIRAAATGSLWARRHRAVAGFLGGFFGSWLLPGALAAALRGTAWAHSALAAGLIFAAAAVWQRTAIHWRAVMACHGIEPLAPRGWRADFDCLRFGAIIGGACVRSCWPLMLACALTGHSPIAMAGGMAVGIAERRYHRPRTRAMLAVTLALASYYAASGLLAPRMVAASSESHTPEIVGSTTESFLLTKGETRVTLSLRAPIDPVLRHAGPQRRVFLNAEKMISDRESVPFDVYLNLPPNGQAADHPELLAGELPMFGLVEASRSYGGRKPEGLYQRLEITDLYARLPVTGKSSGERLVVVFVPRHVADVRIEVARVTISMARR